ncbi:MAG: hypothetical protein RSE13_05945 [Planktothrix sp. GU0601_MAG3]|nr:MAG: hypothetical protein RSE13_05945 [Planktothrix sp. GU0601_MAG3]
MWILTSIALIVGGILAIFLGAALLPFAWVLFVHTVMLLLFALYGAALGSVGWLFFGCTVLGGIFRASGAPESVTLAMCSVSAYYITAFIGAIICISIYIHSLITGEIDIWGHWR